ncbi:HNH endonuclease [Hahella sp. NBU794]|uniref:HNH endonuclease n=1 Tax=Hahella sp. NBU794 TaxID=3422590 RepID=UPI003D701344
MKLTCIYCKTEQFDQGKGSEEHVVLSSLGGRKSSRSICCQKCNIELGKEIDKPLAEGLRIISTFYGIITGRGKEAATLKSYGTHNGRNFDLLPGGRVELSRVKIDRQIDEEKGVVNISVRARNVDEVNKLLKQQLKSLGKGIEDIQIGEITESVEYPKSISVSIDLGLVSQHRSIAKTALTYIATMISPERLRSGCFSNIIEYIIGSEEASNSISMTQINFPPLPNISDAQHRVIISASEDKKMAIGLVELFGGLKFMVALTDCWEGPNLQKGYAVNPLNGDQVEYEDTVNLNDEHWSEKASGFDGGIYLEMVRKVFGAAFNHHVKLEHERIISEVTEEFFKEFGGEDFTDELKMKLSSRIAKAIANSVYKINEYRIIPPDHFKII